MDNSETFFVAYNGSSKSESMEAYVSRLVTDEEAEQQVAGMGAGWAWVKGTEKEMRDLPMKVLVHLCRKATGSAPKKFESLRDGAARVYPHLEKLASETVVKAKIAKAKAEPIKEAKTKEAAPKKTADSGLRAVMDKKIKILAKENPKRPGTRAHAYFEVVRKFEGRTVADFLENARKEPAFKDKPNEVSQELRWNGITKNFIAFV